MSHSLEKSKKILFIYSSIWPILSGPSRHGYNLAKQLSEKGYFLYLYNQDQIDISNTTSIRKFSFFRLLKVLFSVRIVYIRVHSNPFKSILIPLLKFFKKKVIIELNGPLDELKLKGFSDKQIRKQEKMIGPNYGKADKIIVVSERMKFYCINYLNIPTEKVVVIQNGGEDADYKATSPVKEVIWSGSNYPWQGFSFLQEMIGKSKNLINYHIISGEYYEDYKNYKNVFQYTAVKDVDKIYKKVSYALVVYGDFEFSRIGFFNSSLKYYEALAKHKFVLASHHLKDSGHFVNENVIFVKTPQEAVDFILQNNKPPGNFRIRTWKNVAEEVDSVIKLIG